MIYVNDRALILHFYNSIDGQMVLGPAHILSSHRHFFNNSCSLDSENKCILSTAMYSDGSGTVSIVCRWHIDWDALKVVPVDQIELDGLRSLRYQLANNRLLYEIEGRLYCYEYGSTKKTKLPKFKSDVLCTAISSEMILYGLRNGQVFCQRDVNTKAQCIGRLPYTLCRLYMFKDGKRWLALTLDGWVRVYSGFHDVAEPRISFQVLENTHLLMDCKIHEEGSIIAIHRGSMIVVNCLRTGEKLVQFETNTRPGEQPGEECSIGRNDWMFLDEKTIGMVSHQNRMVNLDVFAVGSTQH